MSFKRVVPDAVPSVAHSSRPESAVSATTRAKSPKAVSWSDELDSVALEIVCNSRVPSSVPSDAHITRLPSFFSAENTKDPALPTAVTLSGSLDLSLAISLTSSKDVPSNLYSSSPIKLSYPLPK